MKSLPYKYKKIRSVGDLFSDICSKISESTSLSLIVLELFDYNPFNFKHDCLMLKIKEMLAKKTSLALVVPAQLTSTSHNDFIISEFRVWSKKLLESIPENLRDRVQIYSLKDRPSSELTPFVTRLSYCINLESDMSLNQMFLWLPAKDGDSLFLMVNDAGKEIVQRYPFLSLWFTARKLPSSNDEMDTVIMEDRFQLNVKPGVWVVGL